jgi:RHS repeat-associated protein
VVTANDYYPFGMGMPGRKYSTTSSYRYGFNGKENDNDVKGEGNQQDYGMRIYDPRLGRFVSRDPLTKSYPWFSPYQFAGNSPILNIDLDGLENIPTQPNTQGNKNEFGNYTDAPTPSAETRRTNLIENKMPLLPEEKFLIGIFKPLFYTFAAFTEVAGAAHYGDRIPKEEFAEQFPLIPNNNLLKDVIIPSIVWPVQLINDLKKDPMNPELWGQAFGSIFMGKLVGSQISTRAKINARVTLANNFFKEQGIQISNLFGINFLRGVKRVSLPEGTDLIMWKQPGKSPSGFWYTAAGVDPATLGIPSSYSVGYQIKLTSSVEVLQSVAGDLENFTKAPGNGEILPGGGKQFTTSQIEIGVNAEVKGTINRAHN